MFSNDEEYMDSLKQDDYYHFSVPFDYISERYGDDEVEMDTAIMEVDVEWSNSEHGYKISYSCSDMWKIDPNKGNGDIDEFYDIAVEGIVLSELDSRGITAEAIVV